jgi:hypothetical protein
MRRRRRFLAPVPPTIAAIAIDGANVIASAARSASRRLQLAVDWFAAFRPDLPIAVFVDHATCARLPPAERERLLAWQRQAPPRLRLVICPPGVEADLPLLHHARAETALLVSNDRFFDHPGLRANVLTLQFTLARGVFAPHAEATWFRSPGHARRVPLAELQRDGAAAGAR